MSKAQIPGSAHQRPLADHRRLIAILVFVVIVGGVALVVLIPAGVRALPGRYAVRLPGFLLALRHRPHAEVLPTPVLALSSAGLPTPRPTGPFLSGVSFGTLTPDGSMLQDLARTVTPTPAPVASSTVQSIEQPMPTISATPTETPTPPPTATLTPSPTPTQAVPVRASLPPITHTHQTWNNCGPATVSMALQFFGQNHSQAEAAKFLKPDPEDKNVSPHELAAYAQSLGLGATVRVGGDLERLKRLVASGFPVIVETWFIPEPGDQMGHYRVLTGYDDEVRQFTAQDSYNGPNVKLDYDAFDELWRAFNRVYVLIYQPGQADQMAALLGPDADDETMYLRAVETAQMEAGNPSPECVAYEECDDAEAFAWFNVGSSLNSLGRHQEAAAAYDQARLLGLPWRMLWYQFGPYEVYYAVGRYDDVITLATTTLNVVANLEESHYWRGLAYLAQGDSGRARADFEAAVHYNPNFIPAKVALESLQ
jgi:tetratricopeptide (TPR) repeat protein